jgi:hypothetical protein
MSQAIGSIEKDDFAEWVLDVKFAHKPRLLRIWLNARTVSRTLFDEGTVDLMCRYTLYLIGDMGITLWLLCAGEQAKRRFTSWRDGYVNVLYR